MRRILIVDDEVDAIENLERKLRRINIVLNVKSATTIPDALELIEQESFDLLLLDIHLSKGTGFDLLRRVTNRDFYVIFVTAYDQYAIKAFKFHAFDYLLKPIDIQELESSLYALFKEENNFKKLVNRNPQDLEAGAQNKIAIPHGTGLVYITLSSISHLIADGSYTVIHCGEKRYVAARKIKFFEELLKDSGFCRVHASYMINLSRLLYFHKRNGGEVELDNGMVISVSRSRRANLEKILHTNS